MTSVLGKRKSRSKEPLVSEEDAQEIFRRHFEAQFAPLEETTKPKTRKAKAIVEEEEEEEEEEEDDGDAWEGISEGEGDFEGHEGKKHTVEVVDHTGSKLQDQPASMSKRELKAFMSSRPPSTDAKTQASKAQQEDDPPSDPENEATLRAQDLALQRLLTESHLLSSLTHNANHHGSTHSSQKPFAAGKLRNRTTDLRIQGLISGGGGVGGGGGSGGGGSSGNGPGPKTESIYEQKKMPMNMRKRINATRDAREEKRRRQAKENGIVLEKEKKKGGDAKRTKRERAIDGPEVGRMRGAELRLTDRDVQKIQGAGSGGFRGDKFGKKRRR